jgi:1-deoxy-D-xylulose-5-phosphate synthase
VIVHVRTRKGRGYRPAEADMVSFHGAALPPMTVLEGGDGNAVGPAQEEGDAALPSEQRKQTKKKPPSYTTVMSEELVRIAAEDERVVAITAGMPTGTGLARFQQLYPTRMFDVGIAEQHAVTMATGLALGGERPFVAIYSTFLQRAFDQLVHDVCQNDVPVVIGVDRAGLVGEDGTSHQGMFALPAQRQLPHLVICAPKDEQELRRLLRTAFGQDHPFAIHYPRDPGLDLPAIDATPIPVGEAEVLREGRDVLIVGIGPIVARGMIVADRLAAQGWSVGVVNARFVKPLDRETILAQARSVQLVVTLEESAVDGGFGSAVEEAIEDGAIDDDQLRSVVIKRIGIPADRFVDHGAVDDLRRTIGLDEAGIQSQIEHTLGRLGARPRAADERLEVRSA